MRTVTLGSDCCGAGMKEPTRVKNSLWDSSPSLAAMRPASSSQVSPSLIPSCFAMSGTFDTCGRPQQVVVRASVARGM